MAQVSIGISNNTGQCSSHGPTAQTNCMNQLYDKSGCPTMLQTVLQLQITDHHSEEQTDTNSATDNRNGHDY